jgi:hypothetical protein
MKEKIPNKKEQIGKNRKTRHLMHEARFDGKKRIKTSVLEDVVRDEKEEFPVTAEPSEEGKKMLSKYPNYTGILNAKDGSTETYRGGKLIRTKLGDQVATFDEKGNLKYFGSVSLEPQIETTEPSQADLLAEPVTPTKIEIPEKKIVPPTPEPLKTAAELPKMLGPLAGELQDLATENNDDIKKEFDPNATGLFDISFLNKIGKDPASQTLRGPISGVPTVEQVKEPAPETMPIEEIKKEGDTYQININTATNEEFPGVDESPEKENVKELTEEELEELARLEREVGDN